MAEACFNKQHEQYSEPVYLWPTQKKSTDFAHLIFRNDFFSTYFVRLISQELILLIPKKNQPTCYCAFTGKFSQSTSIKATTIVARSTFSPRCKPVDKKKSKKVNCFLEHVLLIVYCKLWELAFIVILSSSGLTRGLLV